MKRRKSETDRKHSYKPYVPMTALAAESGIALLMALIVTLVVFLLIGSTLYVITQGTRISGSRKVYATCSEAADGSVELLKDAIEKSIALDVIPNVFNNQATFALCLGTTAIMTDGASCTTTVSLPSTMATGGYNATVSVTRLFSKLNVGARIKFPPDPSGSTVSTFFRITTIVTCPDNSRAENSVVYRHS